MTQQQSTVQRDLETELQRIRNRDKAATRWYTVLMLLFVVFGFFSVALGFDYLNKKIESQFVIYQEKIRQAEKNAEKLKAEIQERYDELSETTEQSVAKTEKALESLDTEAKSEINKLWRAAYLTATRNKDDIVKLKDSEAQLKRTLELMRESVENDRKGVNRQLTDVTISTQQIEKTLTQFDTKITQISTDVGDLMATMEDLQESHNHCIYRVTALEKAVSTTGNAEGPSSPMQVPHTGKEAVPLPSTQSTQPLEPKAETSK